MPGFASGPAPSAAWSDVEVGGTATEGMVNPGGTDTNPGTPWPPSAAGGAGLGVDAASTLPILLNRLE